MNIKKPDHNDVIVGSRIRAARAMLGISQTVLANQLGITFQQIQKYEKGVNRISMGRLSKVSEITNQPMAYFSDGLGSTGSVALDTKHIDAVLGTQQGNRMIRAYAKLDAPKQRAVTEMLEAITQDGS